MQNDPFEQFERSRGGLLIPIAIFMLGAALTWLVIGNLQPIVVKTESAEPTGLEPDQLPNATDEMASGCLLYTSPSPRD